MQSFDPPPMPTFEESPRWRQYARQEFMTPGVQETLQLLDAWCRPTAVSRVLEVAYGKGEAACRLASRYGCQVVGVDAHNWTKYSKWKAKGRGLDRLTEFLRGDGKALPIKEQSFDIALCTGGPSIAGEDSLGEMHRALSVGGWIVASDWVWRSRPVPDLAIPTWVRADDPFILIEEYASKLREAGFEIYVAQLLPAHVWDDYYAPMREVGIAGSSEFAFFEQGGRDYWGYAVFIGRKRDK